jgi:hydrogenase nickel incorporation protein HypA/HybF
MHEMSLMNDLLAKIEQIAKENNSGKVSKVCVTIGALAHISEDHFRDHFTEGTTGTIAEGAELSVAVNEDINDPNARDILLTSIDVQ